MSDLELWYRAPAELWTEALPVGNGRLGAMIFGGVGRERLQLNEDTLWAGGPYRPINPAAAEHLEEVRALLFSGRYAEAEAAANRWLLAKPFKQMPYQPAADLWIETDGIDEVTNYRRDLDLDNAIATTRFTAARVEIRREVFATAADGIIVVRLTATGPEPMTLRLRLTSEQAGSAAAGADGSLRFSGRNSASSGIDGALRVVVEARVATDGELHPDGDAVAISGARQATILIDAATSFRRFDDVSGDPLAAVTARLDAAALRSVDELSRRHIEDYRALFARLTIDLGTTPAAADPTDQRIAANTQVPDPALAALFVQYGRYLLIASSRPGTQPANLQGIWNDLMSPPWESKYTTNINLQMNYWLADPGNLAECLEPLIALVEDVAITGRETARLHYDAPGWVLHHNTDLWRATGPVDGAQWGVWPMGGAWLCAQLWDHVRYGNTAVLERLYNVMVGAAEFVAHQLVPLPGTNHLVTAPSISPENIHPHGASLCYGPAMDSQIIRDLFDAVIEAGSRLGRDPDLRRRLAALRERLPGDRIGGAGQLQEWLEDWDMQVPELHHRHVSHLYSLYPSQQISLDGTPEFAAAARRSLEIRGDDATGWGIGWRINLWARLGDGNRAHSIVQRLLSPGRTYPNLFDAHPPFQIDGNFGGAAGILEMLVQSRAGEVLLLPALPAAWPSGRATGIRARGGVEVDLAWEGGVLVRAVLRGASSEPVLVRSGSRSLELTPTPSGRAISADDFGP